jgi:ketosteroid isomerase-like protein
MLHARLLVAGTLALALAGCQGSGSGSVGQSPAASDKATVDAATTAFHDALRGNDIERFMAYVADDVLFMPAGEPPVRGKQAMRDWVAGFFAQYRTTSLKLSDRELRVADGWAVELGTYEWELAPVVGGGSSVDRGSYMQVWQQRSDKTWSFAREAYNSSMAPAPGG